MILQPARAPAVWAGPRSRRSRRRCACQRPGKTKPSAARGSAEGPSLRTRGTGRWEAMLPRFHTLIALTAQPGSGEACITPLRRLSIAKIPKATQVHPGASPPAKGLTNRPPRSESSRHPKEGNRGNPKAAPRGRDGPGGCGQMPAERTAPLRFRRSFTRGRGPRRPVRL